MCLDPVVQGLFNHSQAAGYRCHRLARLHKSNRLLLELKRVTTTRCLRHLRVPFAIKAACYGIRFAGARSEKDYDFHFSFGKGTHNSAQGAAEFPQEMIWLWRDYDAAKTEQEFTPDSAEKDRPYFRIAALNRANDE